MKKLIVYTSGGLGNRLRPISSARRLAQVLDRELLIFWEPDFRCPINFNELFENKYNFIYSDELLKLESAYLAVSEYDIKQEEVLFGRSIFRVLSNKYGLGGQGPDTISNEIENDNIILFSNYFLRQIEMAENVKWLKELRPKKIIQDKINKLIKEYKLSKNVIGAHIRGSDINCNISEYDRQFMRVLNQDNRKIFICSDDRKYEDYFAKKYKNRVIRHKKNNYVFKMYKDKNSWIDNTTMIHDAVYESIIDLYLLAQTNIKIYFENSSFYQIAKLIGEKND